MATYIGGTYVPQQPAQDENFGLLANIMQMKQGQYDANRQKIQQTLDAFGALDVARDQDKEYISEKLNSITSQINNYGNKDLTQPGVTDQILSAVRASARDEKIIGAIQNTKRLRNYQQVAAKAREKNDGSYSDINYDYGLATAGVQEYMNGDIDSVGELNYIPYNDYGKKLNDQVIKILGKKGKKTVPIKVRDAQGNLTGEIVEKTIDGLSPSQLSQISQTMLDPQDMKQIEIDGWYNNGGYRNNDALLSNVDQLTSKKINKLDVEINKTEDKLNNLTEGSEEYVQVEEYLDGLSQNKVNLQTNAEQLRSNPRAAATWLQKEQVVGGIVQRFSPLYEEYVSDYTKDDNYWAKLNYDFKVAKERRRASEQEAKQRTDATGGVTQVQRGLADPEDLPAIEKVVNDEIDIASQEVETGLNRYKSLLEQRAQSGDALAVKKMDQLNTALQDKETGTEDSEIIREFVFSQDYNDPMVLIDENGQNVVANIKGAAERFELYNNGLEAAKAKYKQQHIDTTLDSEQYFSAVNDNKNTTMMWQGRAVPVHEVLKSEGLMGNNGEKLRSIKDKPEVLNELVKSYYANSILTTRGQQVIRTSEYNKRFSRPIEELAKAFGEDIDTVKRDLFNIEGDENLPEKSIFISPNEPTTITGRYLQNALQNRLYDTAAFSDNSLVGDDVDIEKFITNDYRNQEGYIQELNRFRTKLPSQQEFGVTKQTNEALFEVLTALGQTKNSEAFGKREQNFAITFRKEGEEIILEQRKTRDSEEVDAEARVSIPEFQGRFPELSEQFDFASSAAIYTYDKLRDREPLKAESIKYIGDNASTLWEWSAESLLRDRQELVPYLKLQDTKTVLETNHRMLLQNDPASREILNAALINSSNYGIQIKMGQGFNGVPRAYINLVDKLNKKTIHSSRVNGVTELDNFKLILDSAPQVFYGMLLDDIFAQQERGSILGTTTTGYSELAKSLQR